MPEAGAATRLGRRLRNSDTLARAAAALLGAYLRFALRSTRWRIEGERQIRAVAAGGGVVVALWHETLPAVPVLWRRAQAIAPGRRGAILVSRHRDGRFLGRVLGHFGLRPLHGSSDRAGRRKGGAPGTMAMLDALAAGDMVVLTPDGPRGPRRQAAGGAAYLAAKAGVPLVPVAARTSWHVRLGSWDEMEVPLPFGRGAAVCQAPASGELGAALDAAMARAEALLRAPGPPAAATVWRGATALAAPVLRILLRRRARSGREIAGRLPEREGIEREARPAGKLLWVHGSSLGECLSVLPVLQALPPEIAVLLTSGTVTSAQLLPHRLDELGLAARVRHRFAPLDVPAWSARFLDHWRPDAACFLESELWPNQLALCRARDVPVALLNARMSVRSAARWCNAPGFARHVLGHFAWIAAQSAADAARLRSLGAAEAAAPGNLKFIADPLPADPGELARLAALLGDRPRWLAASTHPGDEAIAARIHAALAPRYPGLVTAIVPRHPERGATIAAELGAGLRTLGADPNGLWIADTLGELGLLYRLFPTVFVGKSFAPGGGQNVLEPARLGCAIATGPATANFADPVRVLLDAGGLVVVPDEAALLAWVERSLREPDARRVAGENARRAAGAGSTLAAEMAARLVQLVG